MGRVWWCGPPWIWQQKASDQTGQAVAVLLTRSDSDREAVETEQLYLCGPPSVWQTQSYTHGQAEKT